MANPRRSATMPHLRVSVARWGCCVGFLGAFASPRWLSAREGQDRSQASPQLQVDWDAPPECPDDQSVRSRIDELLGTTAATLAPAEPVLLRGVVRADGSRWTLRFETRGMGVVTSKVVAADTCHELVDAFTLMAAFVLDPSLSGTPHPNVPPHGDAAAARQQVALATVAAPKSQDFAPLPLRVGPLMAIGIGFLPAPSLGTGGMISYGGRLGWHLSALYWLPSDARTSNPYLGGATVGLFAVQPSVCMPLGRSLLLACGAAEMGEIRAHGFDVKHKEEGRSWWVAFSVALSLTLIQTRYVDIHSRLAIGVPLFRPRFVLQNVGAEPTNEVFRPAPVFSVLSVGLDLHAATTESSPAGHASP